MLPSGPQHASFARCCAPHAPANRRDPEVVILMLDEDGAQPGDGGVGELRRVLEVVARDGAEVFGEQLRVFGLPRQQRAELLPTPHAIDARRAALGAVVVGNTMIVGHWELVGRSGTPRSFAPTSVHANSRTASSSPG